MADWRRAEATLPRWLGARPSLALRFLWHYRFALAHQQLWLVPDLAGQLSGPLLLKLLLDAIGDPTQPAHVAYSLAALSLLGTVVGAVANQRVQLIARGMAQRTTSICSAVVVMRTLSASNATAGSDVGRASNLISSDAERMSRVAFRLFLLTYAPLLVLVSVTWLLYILGPAALFAVSPDLTAALTPAGPRPRPIVASAQRTGSLGSSLPDHRHAAGRSPSACHQVRPSESCALITQRGHRLCASGQGEWLDRSLHSTLSHLSQGRD